MQKYIFIFFILTTAFLGCRSTQKPVQVEKGPERQVEVPKVDDSKKDAQKDQDIDQLFKTEEVVVTDMAVRERKVKNMPLQSFQLLSKSVAVGNFTTAKPDILPIPHNTEEYSKINDNVFLSPGTNPLSTFSIDVDAASYANVRRFLNSGQLPYKDAVRIEELVNYFNYDYEDPKGEHPFSVTTEVSQAPWNPDHKLVHIGLQGKKLDYEDMKPSNLVFLVDVSGSMKSPNKLSLLKSAFKLLVKNLDDRDRIAIVAYAGAAGLVLPSTPAKERSTILSALDKLEAGGSTAGGAGIKLAYKVAKENLIEDGNNRVILATDGDFNVGVSSTSELVRTIEEKRNDGIFLTICGFGMGNYKDGRMESISNAGNGNYFYIDNILEANKVFVKEMRATLFTIAKDVKIQIEFNPAKVQAYRLIGYENRMLKSEDFNDDKKDAGELGAGHTVTALYEIIPVGVKSDFIKSVDELKYQKGEVTNQASSDELMTVKLRYKRPKEDTSRLLSMVIKDKATDLANSSDNFKFSAAVAEFGMLLRDSEFKSEASYDNVLKLANEAKGDDSEGYRAEFVQLVKKASLLALN
ncbi:VWA domain-containing protein [candidate division KSB1 bacterium]|nr:VWA domain-containing protein [candidate division KSB1 bacterium]